MLKSTDLAIGVFCGSSFGNEPGYKRAAVALGEELATRGISLVCGGGVGGLMGVLIDASISNGGRVVGVMPEDFVSNERPSARLSELHIVHSIDERKAVIERLSDALIAMPGGIGTVDEFFCAFALVKLGLVQKPIGLLNVCGYYDLLNKFFEKMVDCQFIKNKHKEILISESSPRALLDRLKTSMT
jgi:uncharacterized protein (TIGR00730 family)